MIDTMSLNASLAPVVNLIREREQQIKDQISNEIASANDQTTLVRLMSAGPLSSAQFCKARLSLSPKHTLHPSAS